MRYVAVKREDWCRSSVSSENNSLSKKDVLDKRKSPFGKMEIEGGVARGAWCSLIAYERGSAGSVGSTGSKGLVRRIKIWKRRGV